MITRVPVRTMVDPEPRKAHRNIGECMTCGCRILPGQWYYPCKVLKVDGVDQEDERVIFVHMDCYVDEVRKRKSTMSPKAEQWKDATMKARKVVREIPMSVRKRIKASVK